MYARFSGGRHDADGVIGYRCGNAVRQARSMRLLRVSTAQADADYCGDRQEGNSIDTQRKEAIQKEKRLGTVNVGECVGPRCSGS